MIALPHHLFSKDAWQRLAKQVGTQMGLSNNKALPPLSDSVSLRQFLHTRASHIAQTSLYGYLRTRAGTRYPELFEQPEILQSINMAKWQIWLACLSDLSVYVGGLIHQRSNSTNADICLLLSTIIDDILQETGHPDEAATEFADSAEALRQRLIHCDFSAIADNESAFIQSPEALFYWAPIADELKNRDKEIVENSVRFRWQEIRRSTRKLLQAESLMANSTDDVIR